MRILAINEVWEWCRTNRIAVSDSGTSIEQAPADLVHHSRCEFAPTQRSGRESAAADEALRALGPWDECLLWITGWGIWPNSEDWPAYYAKRGAVHERRSLSDAPGHLFTKAEQELLTEYVIITMENGWDAFMLGNYSPPHSGTQIRISHDGWFEVASADPVSVANTLS